MKTVFDDFMKSLFGEYYFPELRKEYITTGIVTILCCAIIFAVGFYVGRYQ